MGSFIIVTDSTEGAPFADFQKWESASLGKKLNFFANRLLGLNNE